MDLNLNQNILLKNKIMNDQEIIKKATKALKELNLFSNNYNRIQVLKVINDELIELDPELKDKYSVMFSYKLPDGRGAHTSVEVDRKTDKLLYIITRSNIYEIPEELK